MNQEGRRLLKKSSCHAQKPWSEENQEAHDMAMMAISQLYNFLVFYFLWALFSRRYLTIILAFLVKVLQFQEREKYFSMLRNLVVDGFMQNSSTSRPARNSAEVRFSKYSEYSFQAQYAPQRDRGKYIYLDSLLCKTRKKMDRSTTTTTWWQ